MLFGEEWNRTDKLSLRDRSLVTVVALLAQGLTDESFGYHLKTAKNNGITRGEIAEILTHAAFYVGWPKAWAAFRLAKDIWTDGAEDCGGMAEHARSMIFPIGAPNDGYAKYFSGKSYLAPLSAEHVGIYNVTFEPGCVNNWHIHRASEGGGQILVCVAGRGLYGEEGETRQETLSRRRGKHSVKRQTLARRGARQLVFTSCGGSSGKGYGKRVARTRFGER